MKSRFKNLTVNLAAELTETMKEFLMEHLKEEENTSDIINLIMSSHLSAMFTFMRTLSSEHPEILVKVNKFIAKMIAHLDAQSPITSVEFMGLNDEA